MPVDAQQKSSHEIISIPGTDNYALNCRYWAGDKPTTLVIMVHGVISHSLWLESIADLLSMNNVSVLAMDRRGSGLNKHQSGDAPSAQTLLDDLDAVMHWSHQWQLPMHICGFCWGSNYVINYLQNTNLTLQSMILIAPSVFPSEFIKQQPFQTGDSAQATEEPVTPIDQFTDGPMFESFIKPDPLRLCKVSPRFNQCVQQFASGLWMKLLKVKLPCLMLLAEKDTVVDNHASEQVFNRLNAPNKRLRTLCGAHGIQFDQPQQTATQILDWMRDNQVSK